jgi:hypothetical protein
MWIFLGAMFVAVMVLAIVLDWQARRGHMNQPLKRVYYGLAPVPWLVVALLLVNGALDSSAPRAHTARIIGKFSMPGLLKSSRLIVDSWRPDRRVERIPIRRDEIASYQQGEWVEVRVHEGLVGIPWVDSVYHKD